MDMNIGSLSKIMKCVNNDDVVIIKAKDNADVVTFVFESKDGERVSDFEMKLMKLDHEHLEIHKTEYACVIKMSSAEFARIVRDLSQFGKSIVIACSKQGVKFSSTGDIGTGNVKLAKNSGANPNKNSSIELQEPVTLSFAPRYLNSFAKAAGLSDKVTLCMSPDVPLVVEFKIASSNNEYGYIRYYLPPKIEDEDS